MTVLNLNLSSFGKNVSNFKRKYNTSLQIKVDDQFVTEPTSIADAFANHFKSILTHLVRLLLYLILSRHSF
jgi:hypothetical protein